MFFRNAFQDPFFIIIIVIIKLISFMESVIFIQ